ncbi:MAG: ABC transporter ATP-binding protein [Rhodospirillales bacterium]
MSLEIASLTVSYGRTRIVESLSATLAPGALAVLIGPNGSGKSTLLKALAGLLPAQGEVTLGGRQLSARARQEVIAYMPQDSGAVSSLTLLEVVLLGRQSRLGLRLDPAMVTAAQAALDHFGLGDLAARRLSEVSGGQRQMVYLAQTLFREPQVLLLDEPTTALDLQHQLVVLERVRAFLRQRGGYAVLALHDLSLAARFADHLLCLKAGSLVAAGSVATVMTEARIAELYAVDCSILQDPDGRIAVLPLRPSEPGAGPA